MSSTISGLVVTRLIERRRALEASDPACLALRLGVTLDPWQAGVLRSTSSRILLCCSRQSGKSTTVALMAMHRALYRPESLVLILSPSLRQSSETFKKCMEVYRSTGAEVPASSETVLRLELANGSRVLSLPGAERQIRGYSKVNLLLIDEAARVEDDLYYALRPMLAVSRGQLVALSTPFGKRGWFYEAWEKGEGFERFKITARECPRISREFLEEEQRSMPDLIFRSEYLCEFTEPVDSVFRYDDIESAFDPAVKPLFT
jgi:hypothetical protein